MENKIYTVSELSFQIKKVIEQFIAPVWVEGEISNFVQSRAGHIYFSLKDQEAMIRCTIWKNTAYSLPYQIQNGMRFAVRGNVTAYKAQSQYQINIREIRPAGIGNLHLAFEELKQRLKVEGLFDEAAKKPIPSYPNRIGVVTSATGAAIQDILRISERRNPAVQIVIFPAQVQGHGAAETIVKGIRTFNKLNNVDLIIIGRGGGSLEDLWAFNEEVVVRAISESVLPIVSAVGHEVDFTLSDFVSDLSVPTPSASAEMTIPELKEITTSLEHYQYRFGRHISLTIEQYRNEIDKIIRRLKLISPSEILKQRWQRIDELEMRLKNSIHVQLKNYNQRINSVKNVLSAFNPKSILKRGYTIIYEHEKKKILKSCKKLEKNSKINIEFFDGNAESVILKINKK